jgi:hypothetical protein
MSGDPSTDTTIAASFGESFGRYQLRERLGSGGFAEVYRAHDPELSREVALKVILAHFAEDPDLVTRFLQEMRFAAGLSHRSIVPIHDVGRSSSGRPFFTMALVPGETLATRLRRGGPVDPDEVLQLLAPIGAALDYLAERGLVHRDLKPANIILSSPGEATLIDFGIARVAASVTHLTQPGALIGTPAYMAPEQVLGLEVGPAADRYALGIIAYELLSGRPPFAGDTAQILYKQANEPPPPIERVRPGLPPAVSRAIGAALAKDPAQRPESAAALLDGFRRPTQRLPIEERQTQPLAAPAIETDGHDRRARRMLVGVAAAGILALLIVAAVLLLRPRPSPGPTPVQARQTATAAGSVTPTAATVASAASTAVVTAAASPTAASAPVTASAVPVRTPAPAPPTPGATPVRTAPGAGSAPAPAGVVVTERFGAALRVAPSSDAAIFVIASCGEKLPVVAIGDGWYQVHSRSRDLWVGAARVADADAPPPFDCRDALTFQIGDTVVTSVASGCLSLRDSPATDAPFAFCVDNGHRYQILNGPVAADGEDWFQVTSPQTGSGWVIARFLLPAQ